MKIPTKVDLTKVNDTILLNEELHVMTVVNTDKKTFTAVKVKDKKVVPITPGTTVDVLPMAPGAAVLAFPLP